MAGEIKVDYADRVITLTISNLEKRNALGLEMLQSIPQRIEEIFEGAGAEARVIILRGDGNKSFCSGLDLAELSSLAGDEKIKHVEPALRRASRFLREIPLVSIAMLNGHCFGAGGELAINCDLRYGREGITIGMPPVKLGIVYPPEGLKRFVDEIGSAATRELFLLGRAVSAVRAADIGFLNKVLAIDELEKYCFDAAAEIASNNVEALYKMRNNIESVAGDSGKRLFDDSKLIKAWREKNNLEN